MNYNTCTTHNKRTGRKSIFSAIQQEFIKGHYLSMTYREIADHLGFTETQIKGWINHNCKRKYRDGYNGYFSDIDSPEKAYWLGYIYADGWISKSKRSGTRFSGNYRYEFGIELCREDRYMLERLNQQLGGQYQIYDKHKDLVIANNKHVSHTDSSVLRVYSKPLVKDLYNHGIDYNKTYSIKHPVVNIDLFADFLRGYIDGDGCLFLQSHGRSLYVQITAYGHIMLEYIQEHLENDFGIHSSIYKEYEEKHRLVVHSNDSAKRLLDMLYREQNAVCLLRKYEKYKSYYGLAA